MEKPTKNRTRPSFKEILIDKAKDLNRSYISNGQSPLKSSTKEGEPIILPELEKEQIYHPWRFPVIVKLMVRKISYQLLKSEIIELWKPSEPLVLINLGHGFFTVKFKKEKNKIKALQGGSWLVVGVFLSVVNWEPNFTPSTQTLSHSAIWVRPPQLPTEFYDHLILEKISNYLGSLLKINSCTSSTLRGRPIKHKNRYLRGGYWPGKSPHPTTSPQNTSKRLGTPSQNSTKSEDFALEKLGLRLHTSMAPNEAQHHNNTNKTMVRAQNNISLGQKKAQLDNKNKSNARGKNIPAIRNVKINIVDDKTTKVKSINVVTIPTGSTNLIEGLKSTERRVKVTPTAQDMTIEDFPLTLNACIGNQPVILTLQDPHIWPV
ncbi:hypothetical protein BC332_16622 [Capsicum chinense]|nr:hypothetical protein BC332_16622 [Capsicum chinense]